MAKPPPTPPHSDIDGVREDQRRVDIPANASPDPGAKLDHADDESRARPDGTDHTQENEA
jgi:hypothetical protein